MWSVDVLSSDHRNLSTEHTEDTDFFYPRNYLGSCFARNLWRKSLIKIWPMARNQSSDLRRNLYGNKIFKKILTENALEFLASGKDFYGDRLTGSKS